MWTAAQLAAVYVAISVLHLIDRDALRVLLPKAAFDARLASLFLVHLKVMHCGFGGDGLVHKINHLSQLILGNLLWVRHVKADALWCDVAAALVDVITQNFAQTGQQQVCRGMERHGRFAFVAQTTGKLGRRCGLTGDRVLLGGDIKAFGLCNRFALFFQQLFGQFQWEAIGLVEVEGHATGHHVVLHEAADFAFATAQGLQELCFFLLKRIEDLFAGVLHEGIGDRFRDEHFGKLSQKRPFEVEGPAHTGSTPDQAADNVTGILVGWIYAAGQQEHSGAAMVQNDAESTGIVSISLARVLFEPGHRPGKEGRSINIRFAGGGSQNAFKPAAVVNVGLIEQFKTRFGPLVRHENVVANLDKSVAAVGGVQHHIAVRIMVKEHFAVRAARFANRHVAGHPSPRPPVFAVVIDKDTTAARGTVFERLVLDLGVDAVGGKEFGPDLEARVVKIDAKVGIACMDRYGQAVGVKLEHFHLPVHDPADLFGLVGLWIRAQFPTPDHLKEGQVRQVAHLFNVARADTGLNVHKVLAHRVIEAQQIRHHRLHAAADK
mmetsp:Transcript_29287/g.56877  ORF Transcript_29287/g.56877 Transcript_29287/m.56877 type:complete len:549 (-) Transcript_29287:1113-2759(-)